MTLRECYEQLLSWARGCRLKRSMGDDAVHFDGAKGFFSLYLYTERNRYCIRVRPPEDDEGYLGATVTCRKPRAGEDWHRGNDLSDGPFCEKTWLSVLADIVAYECVKLHRPIRLMFEKREREGSDGTPETLSMGEEAQPGCSEAP